MIAFLCILCCGCDERKRHMEPDTCWYFGAFWCTYFVSMFFCPKRVLRVYNEVMWWF